MANIVKIKRSVGSTAPTLGQIAEGQIAFTEGNNVLHYRDAADNIIPIGGSGAFTLRSNNLSDLANAETARTNLGLGTVATLNTGTASGDIAVLGAGGKFGASLLPAIAITEVFVVATIAARDALVVGTGDGQIQTGDVAIVTDASADPAVDEGGATYIYDGTEWQRLRSPTSGATGVAWAEIDFTGSNITDIATRNHNDLQTHQGGTATERYHLTLLTHDRAGSFLNGGTSTHTVIDTHIASTANPHSTSLEQARTQSNLFAGDVDFGNFAILNAVIDGGTF